MSRWSYLSQDSDAAVADDWSDIAIVVATVVADADAANNLWITLAV